MINKRLFKHYGIDTNKDLKIRKICPRPYDTILIDKMGSCYACECQSWLPQSIGNLQVRTLKQIIEDKGMRQHLQSSVSDGTYRYCNNSQCTYLMGQYEAKGEAVDRIRHLRLAIDDSCNLRCPSCRKGLIFHKSGTAYQLGVKLADRINDWLRNYDHQLQVHLGSDGDPFASHVYRHFMDQTPERNNIKYSILTNALMFKEFSPRVPNVIRNLKELGVSMDAASRDTYEQIRLGGRWDKINSELQAISEQKQQHGFTFVLHFVIQEKNYHEMEDMLELGRHYGADRVYLNRMQDWGVMEDFEQHNIFSDKHPEHSRYLRQLDNLKRSVKLKSEAGGSNFLEASQLFENWWAVDDQRHFRLR